MVSRRMLIEKAYQGRPEVPKYTGGEYLMGYREDDGGEIINPAAIQAVAKKVKQDVDVQKEWRLKGEEEAASKRAHAQK